MEVFLYLMVAAGFYEGGWSFSTSIVWPYGLGIKLAQWFLHLETFNDQ